MGTIVLAVFALEGFSSYSYWPTYVLLAFLYAQALVIALRTYWFQRTVLFSLYALAILLATLGWYPSQTLWLEMIAAGVMFVTVGSLAGWQERLSSLALTGVIWLQAEASLREINQEWDLSRAFTGLSAALESRRWDSVLPAVISLSSGRLLWVFLASVFLLGINRQKARLGAIHVSSVIRAPDRPEPFSPTEWSHQALVSDGLMGTILNLLWDLLFAILRVLVSSVVYMSNKVRSFLYWLTKWFLKFADVLIRSIIYMVWVVAEIAIASLEELCLSLVAFVRFLATACLEFFVPVLLTLMVAEILRRMTEALNSYLHGGTFKPVALVFFLLLLPTELVGLCLGTWTLMPGGKSVSWWRSHSDWRTQDSERFWRAGSSHLKSVYESTTNYFTGILVVISTSLFLNLFFFDAIGKITGIGPYSFGTPIAICSAASGLGGVVLLYRKLSR